MKEYVEKLLQDYNKMKQEIELLEFELVNIKSISSNEILESLSLPGITEEVSLKSGVSDKTASLAVSYPQRIEALKNESLQEVYSRLSYLRTTSERLDFCLSKINAHYAAILKEHYFDGYSWRELATLKNISSKTLMKYRDDAIAQIVTLYKSLEKVGLLSILS